MDRPYPTTLLPKGAMRQGRAAGFDTQTIEWRFRDVIVRSMTLTVTISSDYSQYLPA
jgi:hypothetical protein